MAYRQASDRSSNRGLAKPSQQTNAQKVRKTSILKGYTIPKIHQRTECSPIVRRTERLQSTHCAELTELGQQITQLVATQSGRVQYLRHINSHTSSGRGWPMTPEAQTSQRSRWCLIHLHLAGVTNATVLSTVAPQ